MPDSPSKVSPGTLHLVPTPIGHLDDITRRAVDTLGQIDVIACEDTRRTRSLLAHLGISKPLLSYHAHSLPSRAREVVRLLESGRSVALVSDAGTPGLSDPGTLLVQAVVAAQRPVVSLPGPTAAVTALVASGLPTDRFFFIGFLPRRSIRAKRALQRAQATASTVVIYESPYRTLETLELIRDVAGDNAQVVVARELTKVFEEYIRGTACEVLETIRSRNRIKGEVVILFNSNPNEGGEARAAGREPDSL